MMSYPLVSVIMPVFNAAQFLAATITCVLKQTHQHLELIIINDGSTDNSEEIVQSFGDPRVKYYWQQNQGQCVASNFGLSVAGGDYIKCFNADDLMNDLPIKEQ